MSGRRGHPAKWPPKETEMLAKVGTWAVSEVEVVAPLAFHVLAVGDRCVIRLERNGREVPCLVERVERFPKARRPVYFLARH